MQKHSTPTRHLTLQSLKQTRTYFDQEKQDLARGVLEGDQEKNQIVLELHFLMNDLNDFFDEFLGAGKSQRERERDGRLFSGQMPTIIEGSSEKQISSSTLNNSHAIVGRGSNSQTQRRKPKTSIDNLHVLPPSRIHTVTPQKHVEDQQIFSKYHQSVQTINTLRAQCMTLQKTVLKYKSDIVEMSKKNEEFEIQKKYCLDLLVKHTARSQKLQGENRVIRDKLVQFEGKCKELSQEVVEKSELLDQIKEFLKTEDGEGVSQRSSIRVQPSDVEENEKLSAEIMNINRKLGDLVAQNCCLSKMKGEMQRDMEMLIRDNKQFSELVEELQMEIKMQKNKNKEAVKIEHGKTLNDLVHKENKHLLEINYQLSNKLYEIKKANEKLTIQIQHTKTNESFRKSTIMTTTQDQTLMLNKSKFSSDKNNTSQTFFQRNSIHQKDNKRDSMYQKSWREEMEKNRRLESKVNELLHEMEQYEEELDCKRKEIDNLNISLSKRENTSFNDSRARGNEESIEEVRLMSQQTESRLSQDTLMSLKQFTQRFQPSLMDILFIMLRVSQLAELMVNKNKIYGVFPGNVFLILDEPDHPQNIHVKIQKQRDLPKQQTFLFEAPQIVINEVYSPTESSLVWNIGMIFYYLIYKRPYFSTLDEFIDQQSKIQGYLDHVSLEGEVFLEAEGIIAGMLRRDPERRAGLKEVLEGIAMEINKMFEEERQ